MPKKFICIIIALLITFNLPSPIFAQDNSDNPIYIVQPGENLYTIAAKFDTTIDDLIELNGIIDSNLISAGTRLFIPGLEGVSGVLITSPIQLGETLPVVLRKYRLSIDNFQRLNKLTSPSETFVGANLILPSNESEHFSPNNSIVINKDSSLFGESIMSGVNKWYLKKYNSAQSPIALPGETFFYYAEDKTNFSTPFSPYIEKIELTPLPIVQGHTAVIRVFTDQVLELTGSLAGKSVHFYSDPSSDMYYTIDGIHALAEPGLVPISISGNFENGSTFSIDQMILLASGGYINETLTVESTLIDENLNKEESEIIQEILSTPSGEKYWNELFRFPVDGSLDDDSIGFSSYFGNRRTYNSGQYFGFHGGLDFWVVLNSLNIYAPAPGIVIYAGPMDIRGFNTFIDHGQGVVSGYGHQSEILVEPGQRVETGDLIGLIGNTGRVTGPHLHWDIWVNGSQVDPFDWIYNQYP